MAFALPTAASALSTFPEREHFHPCQHTARNARTACAASATDSSSSSEHSKRLFIFGVGYTGLAIALLAQRHGYRVAGTSTTTTTCDLLTRSYGIAAYPFTGASPLPAEAAAALATATHVLSTVPPLPDGTDPVLAQHLGDLETAGGLRWVGYLSSTGVYGDAEGGWVDEETPTVPVTEKAMARLSAERAWRAAAPLGLSAAEHSAAAAADSAASAGDMLSSNGSGGGGAGSGSNDCSAVSPEPGLSDSGGSGDGGGRDGSSGSAGGSSCGGRGVPVRVFRLAGVYGPGRSALDTLEARGGDLEACAGARDATTLISRVHVADIAQAVVEASMNMASVAADSGGGGGRDGGGARRNGGSGSRSGAGGGGETSSSGGSSGSALSSSSDGALSSTSRSVLSSSDACADGGGFLLVNLADSRPASRHEVFSFAASLLSSSSPPLAPDPAAVYRSSRGGGSKRVDGSRLRRMLAAAGLQLIYEDYESGLRAVAEERAFRVSNLQS